MKETGHGAGKIQPLKTEEPKLKRGGGGGGSLSFRLGGRRLRGESLIQALSVPSSQRLLVCVLSVPSVLSLGCSTHSFTCFALLSLHNGPFGNVKEGTRAQKPIPPLLQAAGICKQALEFFCQMLFHPHPKFFSGMKRHCCCCRPRMVRWFVPLLPS